MNSNRDFSSSRGDLVGPNGDDQSAVGNAWNNSLSRRRFLKRSGGATLATLVAWHGTTVRSEASEPGDSGLNLWWVVKQKDQGATVFVPQGSGLSFAEAVKKAIKILDDTSAGTVVDSLRQKGGTEVKPARYSANAGSPTDGGSTGHLRRVDFPAGFKYKIEYFE